MFAVVLNPASGAASTPDADRIRQMFEAEGAEARVVTFSPESVTNVVRDALASSPSAVIAAGGDGTVSTVVSLMADARVPLGILPLGTLNHFAKDLHVPLDLQHAIKVIVAGHVTQIDVGYVNARAFVNNSSIGIYPSIVELREDLRRQGHAKWAAFAIAVARLIRRAHGVTVQVEVDGRDITTRTPFLFIGNNEYTIEGIHLGARSRLNAGKLYAYLAPRQHVRDLPKLLFWALLGHVRQVGAFATIAAAAITVDTPGSRSIPVSVDGEVVVLTTPLRYRIAAKQLNVIVPAA